MTLYTQIPGSLDLSGVIGDDWSMALDWDIALTGYTWESAVVDSAGTSVATITVTIDNAATGLMTLTIADTLTDTLNEKAYRWYLKQTDEGYERIWIAGYFRWYKSKAARFGGSSGTSTVTI